MSPLQAKILEIIVEKKQLRCGEIVFAFPETREIILNGMPKYFVLELADLCDPFVVSAALSNLQRLELINIINFGFSNMDYEELKSHSFVQKRKKYFNEMQEVFTVKLNERGIEINDYGLSFARACMNKGKF